MLGVSREDMQSADLIIKAVYLVVEKSPYSFSLQELTILMKMHAAIKLKFDSNAIKLIWLLILAKLTHVVPLRQFIMNSDVEMKELTTK